MQLSILSQIKACLQETLSELYPESPSAIAIDIESPNEKSFGDFSTNIALKSAKVFKTSPLAIAEQMVSHFTDKIGATDLKEKIEKIEIKKPGFINFFLNHKVFYEVLDQVLAQKQDFGKNDFGKNKKLLLEFVSANPTGPLSIAHARQAAVGDALGNILTFIGFRVQKEYYVNDEGNQINLLGESVKIRAAEFLSNQASSMEGLSENHYQGEYIKDIAQQYIKDKAIKKRTELDGKIPEISLFAVDYLMRIIRKDLEDFHVFFDNWAHQSQIATICQIDKMMGKLKQKDLAYEKESALWFASTRFGDDKDRVLQKSDGSYTYLAPDIVYHEDKFQRGFEHIINIWGPDHHGYIPRIKAAVQALGYKKEAIDVLIVQLATIYKEGKAVSMSTRRGQYISLREVIDEVGVDAARYFFLMRHINQHLDFDLDLAKKETPENPVYYIQYAHARIHSVNRKAQEEALKPKNADFQSLQEAEEIDLLKKMGFFPNILTYCYEKLDPYPLVNYLHELAVCFHKYYDQHRVIDMENKELSSERLTLMNTVKTVLAIGLKLLGLSTPEKM